MPPLHPKTHNVGVHTKIKLGRSDSTRGNGISTDIETLTYDTRQVCSDPLPRHSCKQAANRFQSCCRGHRSRKDQNTISALYQFTFVPHFGNYTDLPTYTPIGAKPNHTENLHRESPGHDFADPRV